VVRDRSDARRRPDPNAARVDDRYTVALGDAAQVDEDSRLYDLFSDRDQQIGPTAEGRRLRRGETTRRVLNGQGALVPEGRGHARQSTGGDPRSREDGEEDGCYFAAAVSAGAISPDPLPCHL